MEGELEEKVERIRKEMYFVANVEGINSINTIMLSQKLDQLLNQLDSLRKQKQR
ncbi:Spo0E family sporulation regulatory protein-aspartic acid phosphatase [Sporosarcina sp. CAU 1771]